MANIRRDDNVMVIAGKDRGKSGKVNRVIREKGRVVVAGVNMATKHVKNRPGIRQAKWGRTGSRGNSHPSPVP